MISGILGKKIGMTQIFQEGKVIPVTVIQAGPCSVLQIKTEERDGYCAVQLGFDDKREKQAKKPEVGHAKKANTVVKRFVREVAWDGKDEPQAGSSVTLSVLEKTKYIDIIGVSKGRGFQGVVRRHHFAGGPKSHGQSDRWRAPGSIGSSAYPSRVFKGMRMGGHMGNARCTMLNQQIVELDEAKGLLAVRGGVPGPDGCYVLIRKSRKNKN